MLKKYICFILAGLVFIALFTVGVGSCQKKSSNTKTGSSSNNIFIINAPSGLTATLISPYQINLSWLDNSTMPPEDGFEIWRSLDGTKWGTTPITTTDANTTSYYDLGLSPLTIYYYRVRAFNTIGDISVWSNEVSTIYILPWLTVTAGETHTLALTTNGAIWVWGNNGSGQLGLGDYSAFTITTPTQLGSYSDWLVVSDTNQSTIEAGYNHSLAIKANRTLWSWGANDFYQLGLGNAIMRTTPSKIGTDSDWSVVSGGGYHSLALKTNKTIWAWGSNYAGQLGLGYSGVGAEEWTPAQVGTDSDWAYIAGGGYHSVALKTDKTIWIWGWNREGQLGLGDYAIDRNTPTQIGTDSDWSLPTASYLNTAALKTNGTIWRWGEYYSPYIPTKIGTDSDWVLIKDGGADIAEGYFLALKSNQTVWSQGFNSSGQLGLGDETTRNSLCQIGTNSDWAYITSGGSHSIGLRADGKIWVWGANDFYQLGLGDTFNRVVPSVLGVPVFPSSLTATVVSSIQVDISWQDRSYNEEGFIIERKSGAGGTYEQIATVGSNAVSYSDIDLIVGTNYYYRIISYNSYGNIFYSNQVLATPILAAPTSLTAANISSTQVDLSWIDNSSYEDGFKIERKTSANGTYQEIATVGSNVIVYSDMTVSDNVYYYRIRAYRASGNSSYSNTIGLIVNLKYGWQAVNTGSTHSVAIRTNNTMWSWGNNQSGQLGLGYTSNSVLSFPYKIGSESDWLKIATGDSYNLGLKTSGIIYSWGYNRYGQLGLGDSGISGKDRYTPTQIGTDSDWASVYAGLRHAVGLKTSGYIYSWGFNLHGQLGLGDSGSPGKDRNTPTQIGSDSDWCNISTRGYHTTALKTSNTIWSWGRNNYGQLGLGDSGDIANRNTPTQIGTDSYWVQICAGYNHTIARKTNNTLYSWGYNNYSQLGLGNTLQRNTPTQIGGGADWVNISEGADFSMARKIDGTLWSWGRNQYGGLGLGYTTGSPSYGVSTPTQIGNDSDWSNSSGSEHSLAIKTNSTLWSWGRNNNGQLGLGNSGDSTNRNTPTMIGE